MIIRRIKIYLTIIASFGFLLLVPRLTYANSSTSGGLICGSSSINLSTLEDITKNNIPTGKAYLELNYQSSPINLSLYINNYNGNQCSLIGNVLVNSNTWVYVGNISSSSNDVIVQGLGIGAAPYQAAAKLLIVPNNQCVPTNACNVNYDGLSGVLQLDDSNILSGATDQIAVYGLKPISGIKVSSVNYYVDSQKSLLYTSKTLGHFNRNYLDGGIHSIQSQIKLANNQTIFANQTIDMGVDWTGTLFLKSLIYRNSGSAAVFIITGICVLILFILLALTRFIYKRHQADKFHGLDSYHPDKRPPTDTDDDVFTSEF
jgi:hypothetical protein